jgi:bifunctional aspartokinase / homoserine dehydrogenase 1
MYVLKFGGSSLANVECIQIAAQVAAEHTRHNAIVVVVSAMARVTDSLLVAANRRQAGDKYWATNLTDIATRHCEAYRQIAGYVPAIFDQQWAAMLEEGANIHSATDIARFSSWGERLSVPLFATALRSTGVIAEPFTGEPIILVDKAGSDMPEASVLATRAWLLPQLAKTFMQGNTPVLPGYIARDANGTIATTGRNGSDYSAAIIGAALGARGVYIYSDVPGIYTSDPRRDSSATLLQRLTYDEAAAIARTGAKVLHPRTVEPLARQGIPLHLRSTFASDEPGTDIVPDSMMLESKLVAK